MKRFLSLLLSLCLTGMAVTAQVSRFASYSSGPQWMTFIGIAHDGDLLYLKSWSQPKAGVNNYTCVFGRYNASANREVATVTLVNISGDNLAGFAPGRNGLLCDKDGNIYLSPDHSDKVFRFNGPLPVSGNMVKDTALTYTLPAPSSPKPLAFDAAGNLYIGARDGAGLAGVYRIEKPLLGGGGPAALDFSTPSVTVNDIDFGRDGSLYICGGGAAIFQYAPDGAIRDTIRFDGANTRICSAEAAADGSLYYVTGTNGAILRYKPDTDTSTLFAGAPGSTGDQADSSTTDPYANARFANMMTITLSDGGQMFGFDAINGSIYRLRAGASYNAGAPPPFSLLQFDAFHYGDVVESSWKIASGSRVASFTLETSLDSLDYTAAGNMAAVTGQQDYILKLPLEKMAAFARLKVTLVDGSVLYSPAQLLRGNVITQQSLSALLYKEQLVIQSTQHRQCRIELYSMEGRLLYQEQDRAIERGVTTVTLPAGLVPFAQVLLVKIYDTLAQHAFKLSML